MNMSQSCGINSYMYYNLQSSHRVHCSSLFGAVLPLVVNLSCRKWTIDLLTQKSMHSKNILINNDITKSKYLGSWYGGSYIVCLYLWPLRQFHSCTTYCIHALQLMILLDFEALCCKTCSWAKKKLIWIHTILILQNIWTIGS